MFRADNREPEAGGSHSGESGKWKVEIVKHAMVNINNQKECPAEMPWQSGLLKIELWPKQGGEGAGHDRS